MAEHFLMILLVVTLGYRLALVITHRQRDPSERRIIAALVLLTVGNAAALPEVTSGASQWLLRLDSAVLNTLIVGAMVLLCAAFGTISRLVAVAGLVGVAALDAGMLLVDRTNVAVLAFYVGLNVLLTVVYAGTGRVTAASLAWAPRQQRPGLRAVVWSLALLSGLAASRILWSVLHFAGVPTGEWMAVSQILSRVFVTLLVGGLTVCTVVQSALAIHNRRNHRRLYDVLEPLWRALVAQYPEVVMREVSGASIHLRFYRRVVECRDALMLLSPRLRLVRAPAGVVADAGSLADFVQRALDAAPDDARSAGMSDLAYPVAVPSSPDLDSEAATLARLSAAMTHTGSEVPAVQFTSTGTTGSAR